MWYNPHYELRSIKQMEHNGGAVNNAGNAQRQGIPLPEGLNAEMAALGKEAQRLHESAEFSAQGQFEQGKFWRSSNHFLGIPASVAGALAASAVFTGAAANSPLVLVGGGLTIVTTILAAIMTATSPEKRMGLAQNSANAFLQISVDLRQFITLDLAHGSYDENRARLTELTSTYFKLAKVADPPGRMAYLRAKRNIEQDGGQDYAADRSA